MKVLERDVKAVVMDYLACVPHSRWWVRNVGSRDWQDSKGRRRIVKFAAPGQSDIYGIWNGVHCEIELKRPGKTPTDEQKQYLLDIRQLGGIAFWTDSLDRLIEHMADAKRERGWK